MKLKFFIKTEKKFDICVFPSRLGTPWRTNSIFMVFLFVCCRRFLNPTKEIRIINNETGEHTVIT